MSVDRPTLTYRMRELVWGLEAELAVVANLSRKIDERVVALNAARAELAARLAALDELLAAADDPHLQRYLRSLVHVRLPQDARRSAGG